MASFYELFISFMLIALAIFSMFAFIISVQGENQVSEKFVDNSLINNTYSELESDLEGLRDKSQSQKTLFEEERPTAGFGTLLLYSIVSSGKVFNSMITGVFNLLIKLPTVFLGLDPVVTSVISTMLLITVIIGLWILYKLGG